MHTLTLMTSTCVSRLQLLMQPFIAIIIFIILCGGFAEGASTVGYDVRPDGSVIDRQGEGFFGYGFYSDNHTLAGLKADMAVIGSAGFNIMVVLPDDNEHIIPLLDAADAYPGLRLIWGSNKGAGGQNLPRIYELMSIIRQRRALFGHQIGDDVHSGSPLNGWPATLDDVAMLHREFTTRDPDHPTFIALGSGPDTVFDQQRCSIAGQEIYPVNGGSKLRLVYESSRSCISQAAPFPLSPWTIIQTFNWATNPQQREPTAPEYRNMLYQSLAAGAKGITGYSFSLGGRLDQRNPALWQEAVAGVDELRQLTPYLLTGKFVRTELGDGLYAATWELPDSVVAMVVHAGHYGTALDPASNSPDPRSVDLPLPAGAIGPAQSMFAGRPAGMTWVNGRLQGQVGLLDVHCYRFNKASAVNLPPTITLDAPSNGTAGSTLTLSASAADSDGSIAKVEFFVDATLVATDSTSPYTTTWTPGAAGSYAVTAKATDNLGAATVSTAQTVAIYAAGAGTGLAGTYFSDMNFADAVVTRTDATVDFDWGNGAPASGVGVDHFSVRWTGQVQAQVSEVYTFTTVSDDGVRLWVNGQQVINNWSDHAPTENSGSITLVAGQKYDLKMEFYENGGGAVAKLLWASSSTAQQIVPTTQLFPSIPGALPAGWSAQDIGSVSVAGSTTQDNGTWTVTGSGADIWGSADGCRFASQRVTGDVQVTAQVSGLTNTNEWAKAGVMIRESLTTGSRHASTFATATNGLAYQRRLTTNGASSHTAGPGSAAPYWVRIARLGNVLISSTSPNGTTWTEIRRETIAMSAAVYVGLAVTSHNNGVLCTGTFTNVQVVGVAAAAN